MLLLKEELSIEVGEVDSIEVDLEMQWGRRKVGSSLSKLQVCVRDLTYNGNLSKANFYQILEYFTSYTSSSYAKDMGVLYAFKQLGTQYGSSIRVTSFRSGH
jgi:hypothetical protein